MAVAAMSHLRRGSHPVPGQSQRIDGLVTPGPEVLDRAARQPGTDGHPERLGDAFGLIGEAVFQVGRNGQVDTGRYGCCVLDGFVLRHCPIEAPERPRETATRRGQGLKPERRQNLGRTEIPRIWQQQRTGSSVQFEKVGRLLNLGAHAPIVGDRRNRRHNFV
jgi:hypothetical protein